MSITYPDHIVADRPVAGNATAGTAPVAESAPYTPVYARSGKARNGRKAVKTWMILAPVGALVLIGGGVAMAIGGNTSEPLVAPVPIESMPAAAPVVAETAPSAVATPAPAQAIAQTAPAPVARQAAEPRNRAPAVRPRVEAAPVVAPVETVAPPAGPQPYLSAAEPAAAAPAPPTPVLPPETVTGPPID
ncbi:hypothetical protein [uncultured Brevundimonas sp.]|uniref:hypothetical protein n=1 Tax=uncultured Brevundimonas sp. TaxID=213418 RepID=UPI0030EDB45F|tara:strand:+ start:53092 stop:53661 length:570 start_codon:yes stop_codon:yes gene_type:complete